MAPQAGLERYVYTFIAKRPIRQLKDKIRALTNRTSQQDPGTVLKRINSILRGWVNYFKHAVCKTTLKALDQFVWRRVTSWWMVLHRWRSKASTNASPTATASGAEFSADGIELFPMVSIAVTRYRYRGNAIPNPLDTRPRLNGRDRGEPGAVRAARRVRRAARRNGPVATPAPRSVPTQQFGRFLSRSASRFSFARTASTSASSPLPKATLTSPALTGSAARATTCMIT